MKILKSGACEQFEDSQNLNGKITFLNYFYLYNNLNVYNEIIMHRNFRTSISLVVFTLKLVKILQSSHPVQRNLPYIQGHYTQVYIPT